MGAALDGATPDDAGDKAGAGVTAPLVEGEYLVAEANDNQVIGGVKEHLRLPLGELLAGQQGDERGGRAHGSLFHSKEGLR
jgi:hypothetical protein